MELDIWKKRSKFCSTVIFLYLYCVYKSMLEEEILCPICENVTIHITIKDCHERLVKCTSCGIVYSIPKDRGSYSSLRIIVSRGVSSERYQISIPDNEVLRVGDELVVDDESHDLVLAEITSLEGNGRYDSARASEVKTVWARAIDLVVVKLSIHSGGKTRSLRLQTEGDKSFEVGKIEELGKIRFRVNKIKLRKGGFVDGARAKEILRIWGRLI